jgi:CheY-like chemotaxis protein
MGGALTVTSVVGTGSTFTLELPSCAAPSSDALASSAGQRSGHAGSAPLTVLVVEDNVANIRLMEEVFDRVPNVTLVSAIQGRLGLDLAAQHRPDVILLDLHLPDLDGEEVLRELQADPATATIPVVVCSADATVSQEDRLRAQGAAAYLTKPFDLDDLYALIERVRAGEPLHRSPGG